MKPGEIAHSVSRGAFYLALEKVVALFSGIAYFALLLRWLGPTKYGIMTLALSFAGLATMANGNFEVYLERFAAEFQAHGRFATLRRAHLIALSVKFVLGLGAALLLAALAPWLAHHFAMPELATLLPVLTALVVTDSLATTARATLYGLQHFRWVSLLAVVFHVAKTIMVGALWGMHFGLQELAMGLAVLTLAQGVVSALVPLALLRGARDADRLAEPPRALLSAMSRYCLPLLGARAAFLSGQNLSKVVLGKLFDAAQLGYFSFAFQTVERFVEVVYVLPSSLLPSLTHLVARDERERMRWVFEQAFRLIQVAAVLLSVALFVYAPELTRIVGSPLFAPAVPVLRILALVPIARTAQQPLTMLFQAMRRPGVVLGLAIAKFLVEFSCYFTIVPRMGVLGGGIANLAGAVVSFAIAMVVARRLLPEGAPERTRAVARSVVLALSLVAIALAAEATLPYRGALAVRMALAPVMLLAVFALGLVTRYDLEKLSSLPLRAPWLRQSRDALVGFADRLARALEPRRA